MKETDKTAEPTALFDMDSTLPPAREVELERDVDRHVAGNLGEDQERMQEIRATAGDGNGGVLRANAEEPGPDPVYTRSCEGYVYFADQGIEVCETCGGCTCCDHVDVDHRKARYRCLLDWDGKECLLGKSSNLNHDCERDVCVARWGQDLVTP